MNGIKLKYLCLHVEVEFDSEGQKEVVAKVQERLGSGFIVS